MPGFGSRPAIAVLPFDDFSGSPGDASFADGLVEELTTQLATWRWFPVIARNSAFRYRGANPDMRAVSRELGARWLIEGSARHADGRARIHVQLIDGARDAHVWAERFEVRSAHVFDAQDEIVQGIVGALEPAIARIERMRALRKPVEKLTAWESLQRGLFFLTRQRFHDLDEAEPHLRRSVELEAELAPGWAALAQLGVRDSRARWVWLASAKPP